MKKLLSHWEPFWGEWVLDDFIGSGACGEVWKIKNEQKYAALKIVSLFMDKSQYKRIKYEGMTNDNFQYYMQDIRRNIVTEYELMRELRGSNHIVHVYEHKEILVDTPKKGWMMLYRMDLLEPFVAHLRSIPLTIQEIIKIGIHICHALDICWKHNILHRDIAPGNLFYSPATDSYVLGDFGMAQKTSDILSVPEKVGTYAPPEVYGKNHYSFQSDLYQLGIILYRMVNDFRIPFLPAFPGYYTQKERGIALFRRYQGEMPPLPHICLRLRQMSAHENMQWSGSGVIITADTVTMAKKLVQIIMKAIHPDLKVRYATAYEFQRDLELLL